MDENRKKWVPGIVPKVVSDVCTFPTCRCWSATRDNLWFPSLFQRVCCTRHLLFPWLQPQDEFYYILVDADDGRCCCASLTIVVFTFMFKKTAMRVQIRQQTIRVRGVHSFCPALHQNLNYWRKTLTASFRLIMLRPKYLVQTIKKTKLFFQPTLHLAGLVYPTQQLWLTCWSFLLEFKKEAWEISQKSLECLKYVCAGR